MYKKTKFLRGSDSCLIMEFGSSIDPEINKKVQRLYRALEELEVDFIREALPSYRSLAIYYDPLKISPGELSHWLAKLDADCQEVKEPARRILELPTLYGGQVGPDLEYVAEQAGLSKKEVIRLHSSVDYLVYMLGFTPGFAYLGGMDGRIATPRLKTPRTKIPPGSVGIAGSQTGVYPIESPGGWQLIGRTPLKLYQPLREPPVLLRAGDYLRFVEVDERRYLEIIEEINNQDFTPRILEEASHELL